MPVFSNTEQFYRVTKTLFDKIQKENPSAAAELESSKLIIRFNTSDPTAMLVLNGRRHPAEVSYGENRVRPEVDVSMTADTLHKILLGELGLAKALSSKALRVRGPMRKTLKVADLFHQCQEYYSDALREEGIWTG
jgi:putative sterol carrier protein